MIEDRRIRLRRTRYQAARGLPYQAERFGGKGDSYNAAG